MKKFLRFVFPFLCLILLTIILFQSCYSVRLSSMHAVPMAEADNGREDFYRNKLMVEKDTVITLGVADKDFTMLLDCDLEGLHTVEYRNTLGGVLLSGITFGKKRKVKIKYVCVEPNND